MPQRCKQSNRSPPSFHVETMEQRILFSADAALTSLDLTPELQTELVRLQHSEHMDSAEQDALSSGHTNSNVFSPRELYIVDSALPEAKEQLTDSVLNENEHVSVAVVDAHSDVLTQISEILAKQHDLSALHLVSHRSDGMLELGGQSVGTLDLLARANEITQWRDALAPNAEFQLHSSASEQDANDTKFIDTMARLTGASVSASSSANLSKVFASDSTADVRAVHDARAVATDGTATELVFVQSDLADSNTLIRELRQSALAAGKSLSIVMLDVSKDGFKQIDTTLRQFANLDAIHFVTHGADAMIQLGDSLLSANNVNQHVASLETWGSVLSESGDILFYGCDVAATEEGRWLVQRLGDHTGADVAASENTTGHKEFDGDWVLEYRYGELNTTVPINDAVQQDWFGALDIATDLVLHFEFEENGGATATDSTVNGNDGSWSTAPTWSGDAAVGSHSMDFELDAGSNAFVSVSDDASLDISGDFSVAFWYNATSVQANLTQLVGQYTTGDGFFIYANANGDLHFLIDGSGGLVNYQYVNGFVGDGNWHHVVATRSGNDFQMYVDGVAGSISTASLGTVTSNEPLLIGGTSSSDYEGKLDEVRLYTRTLSASDIAELYAYTGVASDITTGLILHNTFDADASDSSGNNYDGTLTNGAVINTTVGTNQIGAGKVSFDGTNDYVDLSAHAANFDNLAQGTIAVWVYTDAVSGSNVIFQTSDSSDADSRVALIRDGDEIVFYVKEGTSDQLNVTTTSANLTAGSWNHVAVTVDASGNKIYVDGVQQSVGYLTGSVSTDRFFDDVTLLDFIGWGVDKFNTNSFAGHFDGFLDDGRIYNLALSSADIYELYNYTGSPNPQTYTVTNTLDDGSAGSLRWAINQANTNLGADTIDFNIAGTGAHTINLLSALPDITEEVVIDATSDDSFAANGSNPAIVIDANDGAFDGFRFTSNADNSEIRGFVIRDIGLDAIEIQAGASGVTVAGNWIGRYDSDGTVVASEDIGGAPIRVWGDNNTIGGITAADRNVIHDLNYSGGVALDGASAINNTIAGNYFGTNVDGNSAVEGTDNYAGYGIFSFNGANTNTIGGANDNHRNIFGGVWEGIGFYAEDGDNNTVQNNWFGLGADGVSIIHNEVAGVRMDDADTNTITENVFVGAKWGAGVRIDSGANDSIIQGNFFGTDENGHLVAGNWNAVDVTGTTFGTIIGGVGAGEGNLIANSADNAIELSAFSVGTTVRGNAIYDNVKLGIDLNDDGVTLNDIADTDTGANNLQNWAVLNSATIANDGTFGYNLDTTSLASGTYTIDFYASADRALGQVQGERYIGAVTGVSDGNSALVGTLAGVAMNVGEFVTLITTDAFGNSSEFSSYVMAMDGDNDGVSPEDIKTIATTDGGLTINNDGGNDIYLIADDGDALLAGRTAVSFETEFASLTNTDYLTLISYATASNQNELVLEIQGNGSATLHVAGFSISSTAFNYLNLWDGAKHTIGFTWDGSNGNWAIYADGVVVDSNTISAIQLASGETIEGGGILLFGQEQDSLEGDFSTTQEFFGTLYNARLFDDVRTEAQMSASYQSNLSRDENGLLAQWTFDNLSVDGVVTDSVSGNNLTIKHTDELGFTRSEASLTFAADENALNGSIVGRLYGLDPQREAEISALLTANPNLHFSAETGKFYEYVDTGKDWATALADAQTSTLNGVNGNLIAINSATENQIVVDILNKHGGPQVWLAASDEGVEGEWRWYDAGSANELFWKGDGDGYNINDAYENWGASNPNDASGQDYAKLFASTGDWDDVNGTGLQKSIIEYDANVVLDATQELTYTITAQTGAGAFDIDASTGDIFVLDGTKLDADTQPVHTISVQVADVNNNTFSKNFTIALNDLIDGDNVPTSLSSGIELNSDDGNGAFLRAIDGGAVLGGLTQFTIETTFDITDTVGDNVLIDYGTTSTDNAVQVIVTDLGELQFRINGIAVLDASIDYSELLFDNQPHHFALSWDNTNGDVAVYVDGKLIETRTNNFSGQTVDGGPSDGTLLFGQNQHSGFGFFNTNDGFSGAIYDIRIWNEARSAVEIALNHQHKFDSGSLPGGLIANWQMDGLNGSNEVVDVVAGNNLISRHVAAIPLDEYTNLIGGVSTYGSLIMQDASSASGGYTSQVNSVYLSSLGFTDDYTVSFTLDEVDVYNFMIGLALIDSGAHYTGIDHAMYFASNGNLFSYQSGTGGPGSGTSPAADDEFSFYVNGTTLEYKHNGITFHTETITANSNWYLDTSFTNEADVSLSNVRVFHGAVENTNFSFSETPVVDLHISENTINGARVGFIEPSDPDTPQDIVNDGQFLKGDTGAWTDYSQGQTFGGWTVESGVVSHTSQYTSANGGVGLELQRIDGDFPSAITQTLTTEVGKQYQVVFGMSGNFSGGEAVKHLTASANGQSKDFQVEQTAAIGTVYEARSFTFTADSASTLLRFASAADDGWAALITDVQVFEIPQAINTILNNDSTLTYDAATGKFYRYVHSYIPWTSAQSIANAALLNGVAGQLAIVESDYENELIRNLSGTGYGTWLGGTDQSVEGAFYWIENGVDTNQFWQGDETGTAIDSVYSNFQPFDPNNIGDADFVYQMKATGLWDDGDAAAINTFVIEWDAGSVLSNYTFNLTDDAGGRLALNTDTGEVSVATAAIIDFETSSSHSIDVQVTDATGYTYADSLLIQVDNGIEPTQSVPGAQSTNEDTPLIFSTVNGNAIKVSDTVGTNNTRLQAFISTNNNGTLTLSQTNGLSILGGSNGGAFMTIQGAESDINAAFEGMTFYPVNGFTGNVTLDVNTAFAADMAGHYTFESATVSGSNVADQSTGLSHNGTLSGNASVLNDTERGDVLVLDGAGDFVQIDGLMGNPADVTLSAWINADSVDTFGAVAISMGSSPALYLDYDGTLIGFYESGGANNLLQSEESLIGTGWRHVAVSIDSTNSSMTLYVDGVAVETTSTIGPIEYDNSPDTYIGRAGDGLAGFDFDGMIDNARVHSRALSSAEIAALAADNTNSSDSVVITVDSVNSAPTFYAGDGIATNFPTTGDWVSDLVRLDDGKFVSIGVSADGVILTQFNADGSVDTGFGTSGRAAATLGGGVSVQAGALQDDGKFLVVGRLNNESFIARFNADGSLDTSFDGDGLFTINLSGSSSEYLNDVVVQTDGNIVAAGYANFGVSDDRMTVVRVDTDGNLDVSFNGTGYQILDIGADDDRFNAVTLDSSGRIIAAGTSHNGTDSDIAIVRFNSNGSLDTTLDTGGIAVFDISAGNYDGAQAVAVDSAGRIVIGGITNFGNIESLALRLLNDGNLDTSFNAVGYNVIAAGIPFEDISDIALQSDGKIVMVGSAYTPAGINDVSVIRLNTNGTLDNTFNGDGLIRQPIGTATDEASAVVIAPDGDIIVAGRTDAGSSGFHLMRFDSNGNLDSRFNLENTLDGTPTFIENGPAVVLDSDVAVFDSELNALNAGNGNFAGASATLVRNGGINADDVFGFNDNNGITLSGGNLLKNSQIVATFDTTSSVGELVITFTDANGEIPTSTDVANILRQITYANSNNTPPSSAQIDWTIDDGNVTSQGTGGSLTATGSVLVNIVNRVDLDVSAPATVSTNEDTQLVYSGGNVISVDDGVVADTPLRVTLTVGNGTLALSSLVGITFVEGADGSSTIVIDGLESNINAALNGLRFTPNTDYNGADTLKVTTAIAAGLEGHYTFNDTTADDSSAGTSHDGVFNGNAVTINDTERGEVLNLDGNGDFVTISSDFDEPTEFTLAAWVNLTASDTLGAEVITLGHGHAIRLDGFNGPIGFYWDGATWNETQGGVGNNMAGTGWRHVSYTVDSANDVQSLYIDGVLVSETFHATDAVFDGSGTRIGQQGAGSSDYDFNGMIDDARIYTRALTAEEIAALAIDQTELEDNVGITINTVNDAPRLVQPELITNGDFTTDISAWTTTGTVDHTAGSLRFGGGNAVGPHTASQTINTLSGTTYELTFDYRDGRNDFNQSLQVTIDGASNLLTTPHIVTDVTGTTYVRYTFSFTADASTATVTFTDTSDTAGVSDGTNTVDGHIDNVSVRYLSGIMSKVTYIEDAPAIVLEPAISIFDAELSNANNFAGATLTLARNGAVSSDDEWDFNDGNGISLSGGKLVKNSQIIADFDVVTTDGELVIAFTDVNGETPTNDDVNAIMRQITYNNDDDTPLASVQIDWTFNDGGDTVYTQGGAALEVIGSTVVNITATNDDPVITSDGGGESAAVSAAENQTAVTSVTSSDVDGGTPTYTIAGGVDAALFSINGVSGALTFNTAPDFETPADVGANNVYDVTVQVADGNGGTDTQTIAVTVTNVNEDPVITSDGGGVSATVSAAENQTAVTTVISTDVDGGTPSYTIVGGADAALFSVNSVSGALTFNSAPDFETPTDAGVNNVYDVTVQVADGNGGTDTQAIAVTVTNVNEDPVITSDGGGVTATVSTAENQTAVTTVTSTDVDGGTASYSIVGGLDAALFSINSVSGAITFSAPPDFETPTDSDTNNVYDVIVQVADGNSGTDTQAIAVTVTNVNEAPVITSDGAGVSAAVSAAENQTAVTTVSSADIDGDVPNYSIVGGADATLFGINSASGALTFNTAPDYETPTDTDANNVYEITVQVADGNGGTDTQTIAVTVTNVNEAPIITNDGGGTIAALTTAENQTAVTTVTSTDVDGGAASYSITGGADAALFSINSVSGALTFNTTPDFETPTDAGANNVYDVTVQVADGNGGTDAQAIAVTVTNVNEDPLITSDGGGVSATVSAAENQTAVTTVTSTDVDGGTPSYSITGGADAALFSINSASGALAFNTAPDFETPADADANSVYEVIVQVADGNGGTNTQAIAVSVTNVNENPVIISSSAINTAENQTVATTIVSTDVDGGAPSYSISGGADAALFNINNSSGLLTFNSIPDFEAPADAGADNIYNVTVQVSDGNGGTDTQAVAVTVMNVNETPVITSDGGGASAALSVAENQTTVTTVTSTDVDGGTPGYSIAGGADAALFSIDSSTGVLTFNAAPDYETPDDANTNNVYDVIVQVDDGNGGTDTQSIAVTVSNVNEDPVITSAANASAVENQATVTIVTSADVDGGTPTYSITGGADAALFSINSVNGALTFNAAPDFETPTDAEADNVYEVTVQVADGNGGANTQAVTITVTDANEAPAIDTDSIDNGNNGNNNIPLNISINENQRWVMQIPVSDVDADDVLSYSVTGGEDQAAFVIDSGSGELNFVVAPDFEFKNSFEVEVTVTDSGGLSAAQTLLINVLNVNESPIAQTDILEATENQQLVMDPIAALLSNDTDPEQDELSLVGFSQPQNGALTMNAQGMLVYVPSVQFVGMDSFEYVIEDTNGLQVSAIVWLDVKPLNDPILAPALPSVESLVEITALNPEEAAVSTLVTTTELPSKNPVITEPDMANEVGETESEADEEGARPNATIIQELFAPTESAHTNEQNVSTGRQPPPSATVPIARAIENLLQELLDLDMAQLESRFDLEILEQTLSIELRDAILALRGQVDQMSDQADTTTALETFAPSVVGASLTAGIVTWVLRSGLLLSVTITATPLWRPLDPVPILANSDDDDQWYEKDSANDSDVSSSAANGGENEDVGHG